MPHHHVTEAIYGALLDGTHNYFFHEENNLKEIHIVDIIPDILQRLDTVLRSGCQSQGSAVLREIADSNSYTAVTACLSPKPHRMPNLVDQPRVNSFTMNEVAIPADINNACRGYDTDTDDGPNYASGVKDATSPSFSSQAGESHSEVPRNHSSRGKTGQDHDRPKNTRRGSGRGGKGKDSERASDDSAGMAEWSNENDDDAMMQLGHWLGAQQAMEDTFDVLEQEGWMA